MQPPTSQNLEALARADRVLRTFRVATSPNVSAQVLQAFLAVALHEGRSVGEIADHLGVNISTASRQLLDLADRNRKREPGFRLIKAHEDYMNLRLTRYRLTQRGKLLADSMAELLQEPS